MPSSTYPRLAVRVDASNPNHHLFCNNGTWWIHYTVHLPDFTARRVRRSLVTRSLSTARRRRDSQLAALQQNGRAA
jgi:hypothetical protein